jgi:hypothetical protein
MNDTDILVGKTESARKSRTHFSSVQNGSFRKKRRKKLQKKKFGNLRENTHQIYNTLNTRFVGDL